MAAFLTAVPALPVVQPGGPIQAYPNLNPIAMQALSPAVVDGSGVGLHGLSDRASDPSMALKSPGLGAR